jgi:Xaa-Pro aminopeptidase
LFKNKNEIINRNNLVYLINASIAGESSKSKIKRLKKILENEKIDNLFISSGENVCWLLNIRGKDLPNSPIANFQAIITSNKNIILFGNIKKLKNIKKEFLKNKISLEEVKERVAIRTRQYAKRQLTWQRGQMKDWKGFNDTNYLDLRKKILSYLSKT